MAGAGDHEARVWSSRGGVLWQTSALPDALHASVARVISTGDGFVAIGTGSRPRPGKPPRYDGLIWTSADGIAWSEPVVVKGAQLDDIDSNGDVTVIAGGLVSNRGTPTSYAVRYTPTVWTSRAGGAWQAAPIDGKGKGSTSVAISADGTYLVHDRVGGSLRRSTDGRRFVPTAIPGERFGWGSGLMEGGPDGFILVDGRKGRLKTWTSVNGREWRRGETLPGLGSGPDYEALARSGVVSTRLDRGGGPALPILQILRADGSWCAVSASAPFAALESLDPSARFAAMASSGDGRLVLVGFGIRISESDPGDRTAVPLVWQSTGVTCLQ